MSLQNYVQIVELHIIISVNHVNCIIVNQSLGLTRLLASIYTIKRLVYVGRGALKMHTISRLQSTVL